MMTNDTATENRLRRGHLVVIVGASGAGKDTLIAYARNRLDLHEDVYFVRRVITRARDCGGEDHDAVSRAEFDRMSEAGRFAVNWQAHGLHYGIPSEAQDRIALGKLVIANGSREALPRFRAVFPSLTVVNITARPEILATRLEKRGRETHAEVLQRLKRRAVLLPVDDGIVTIDNSGSIDDAGTALVNVLARFLPIQDEPKQT